MVVGDGVKLNNGGIIGGIGGGGGSAFVRWL